VDIDAQAACDATVATPGEWQCGVRRLAVANGPNIFQMLLVTLAENGNENIYRDKIIVQRKSLENVNMCFSSESKTF